MAKTPTPTSIGTTNEDTDRSGTIPSNYKDLVPGTYTTEKGATVTIASGTWTYDPRTSATLQGLDTGETATDTITVLSGKNKVALGTITVTGVNDFPVQMWDGPFTTAEDTSLTISDETLLANDYDVDGEPMYVGVPGPGQNGTTTRTDDGVVYTPNPGFYGTDWFWYSTFDDQGAYGSVSVTVVVTPVNDAPVAVADAFTIAEGEQLSFSREALLANDSDPERDPITTDDGFLIYGTIAGGTVREEGGNLVYTPPNPDFAGEDWFMYQSFDGELYSEPVRATITVTPVDDGTQSFQPVSASAMSQFVGSDQSYMDGVPRAFKINAPGDHRETRTSAEFDADWSGSLTKATLTLDPSGLRGTENGLILEGSVTVGVYAYADSADGTVNPADWSGDVLVGSFTVPFDGETHHVVVDLDEAALEPLLAEAAADDGIVGLQLQVEDPFPTPTGSAEYIGVHVYQSQWDLALA
ncbi:tandem-95 repeat protein [Microvirga sp. 0TCS3.31]